LSVHRAGIDVRGGTLPRSAIGDVRNADNRIAIHRAGTSEPVASVPLGDASAVLIPGVIAAFAR
jgi:hypothetical protein